MQGVDLGGRRIMKTDGGMKQEWVEESLKLAKLAGMNEIPPAAEMFSTRFVPGKTVAPSAP